MKAKFLELVDAMVHEQPAPVVHDIEAPARPRPNGEDPGHRPRDRMEPTAHAGNRMRDRKIINKDVATKIHVFQLAGTLNHIDYTLGMPLWEALRALDAWGDTECVSSRASLSFEQ